MELTQANPACNGAQFVQALLKGPVDSRICATCRESYVELIERFVIWRDKGEVHMSDWQYLFSVLHQHTANIVPDSIDNRHAILSSMAKYVYLCRNVDISVRFEVSAAAAVKITVFCDVTPCRLGSNA